MVGHASEDSRQSPRHHHRAVGESRRVTSENEPDPFFAFSSFSPLLGNPSGALRQGDIPTGCGCLKSVIFHEAIHWDRKFEGMGRPAEESAVRRETKKCFTCASGFEESGGGCEGCDDLDSRVAIFYCYGFRCLRIPKMAGSTK